MLFRNWNIKFCVLIRTISKQFNLNLFMPKKSLAYLKKEFFCVTFENLIVNLLIMVIVRILEADSLLSFFLHFSKLENETHYNQF